MIILTCLFGCEKVENPVTTNENVTLQKGSKKTVRVTNVGQLYSTVNDPANSGKTLLLKAGTYVLSENDPAGTPRPNGGRLELQQNMSLSGMSHRSSVIIDASGLPNSSFVVTSGRTGPIRIGRGKNSVESLTIIGNDRAAGGIETDLIGTPTTQIKIAHVISNGSLRGIDVRNIGADMLGRRIYAEIVDNKCSGITEGIRLLNANGADKAQIYADLRGNIVHNFYIGCIVNNNRCSSAVIKARSYNDKFTGNGLGALIAGGTAVSGTSVSNYTTFEAHGSAFINNTGPVEPNFGDAGGLLVLGADTPGHSDGTFYNKVAVRLWGTRVFGNQNINFQAFGSRSLADPPALGGTNNHAVVELHGISKKIHVVAIDSSPVDPNNTNTVKVIRRRR